MKLIFIAAFAALTLGSCGNTGDKNANDLNSVKRDSSLSDKRADTIQTPGKGAGTQTLKSTDSLSNSGSNEQKVKLTKDSSNSKQ